MSFTASFYSPKFIPAHLCNDKSRGQCIVYGIQNDQGDMTYKYVKLNRMRSMLKTNDFEKYVESTINEINAQLLSVNVITLSADERQRTSITSALENFITEKERELRPASMRSYRSICRVMGNWIVKNYGDIPVGSIKKLHAVRYLEYYYNERNVGNNCYNNQMKLARGVFSWFVQHCYIEVNPFENIAPKIREQKKRGLIDKSTRDKISAYLTSRQEWGMLLVCHLVYSALIRPKEISMLSIGDINLKDHYITLSSQVTKTHHGRTAAITPEIEDILINRLRVHLYPPHYYILGSNWLPARTPCNTQLFSKRFIRLRKELSLPDTMQLYSFRDSGISDLLRQGVDAISVMHHADHHSLEITTRYANHVDAHLVDMMYNRSVGF